MFNSYKVNTLQYVPELCIGCAMCWTVCPHGVFAEGKTAQLVNQEVCMECGACALNCPTNAIAVQSGVGCASGMIKAAITGKPNECCDCSNPRCQSEIVPILSGRAKNLRMRRMAPPLP